MSKAEKERQAELDERDARLALVPGSGLVEQVAKAQVEALERWRREGGEAQQLPLLEPDGPAEFLEVDDDGEGGEGGKRGPGRPKGSRNKRAEDFLGYLRSRYRSPLEGLAVTWSRSVLQLAAELDCTLKEAAQIQVEAMRAALPFWEQRLPLKLDIEGVALPTLVTMDPAALLALLQTLPENDPGRAGIEFLAPLLEHQPVADESEKDQ